MIVWQRTTSPANRYTDWFAAGGFFGLIDEFLCVFQLTIL